MFNKVLNILGWVVFVLSIVAYFADDVPVEACYLVLAALFLTTQWTSRLAQDK